MDDIEVGVGAGELRYWIATEARRQGEIRLNAQAANLTSMEARATSILAWSVAASLAIAATGSRNQVFAGAVGAIFLLGLAALLCIAALWPSRWTPPGYSFDALQMMIASNELQVSEQIAAGYADGIAMNDRRTRRFVLLLRYAWFAFVAAPVWVGLRAVFSV